MTKYIGVKLVTGEPMTRKEYNDYRGWDLPADENGDDEGYLVEYNDPMPDRKGYVSWSPKVVFENANFAANDLLAGIKAMDKIAAFQGVTTPEPTLNEVCSGVSPAKRNGNILMGRDNHEGWKLEDLLDKLCLEVEAKTELIKDSEHAQRDMIWNNNNTIVLCLRQVAEVQRNTYKELDAVAPNKGPEEPRL
jgi:hypothetical protein